MGKVSIDKFMESDEPEICNACGKELTGLVDPMFVYYNFSGPHDMYCPGCHSELNHKTIRRSK